MKTAAILQQRKGESNIGLESQR
ncbi:hypothetical protein HKBW3S09_01376, partial [Candidatus Hakubella thermalkaliphila]